MAKIIETTETAYLIEKMLLESEKRFVIVCPFLQIHERMKGIILEKLSDPIFQIQIATRETGKEHLHWIKSKNISISIIENLHAKYYYNEYEAIVTSMNLYEYSMVNNIEVGVYFSMQNGDDLSFFDKHYRRITLPNLTSVNDILVKTMPEDERLRLEEKRRKRREQMRVVNFDVPDPTDKIQVGEDSAS